MALAISEHDKLKAIETRIESNLRAFYEIGEDLKKIRDDRLYKTAGFDRFEDYCKERWDMQRANAYRLIESSVVIKNLSPMGDTPQSERQARPLTRLSAPLQVEAWQKAVDTAPDGKVTARHVNCIVKEIIGGEVSNRIESNKNQANRIVKEDIVSEDFKKAYDVFYESVQDARLDNWKSTSMEACLKMVGYINDLITL